MTTKGKTIIIIAGVAGEIGTNFAIELLRQGFHVLGTLRNKKVGNLGPNFFTVQCELSSEKSILENFKEIPLENYERIIYLHTIGMDKFTPRNYPDIQKLSTIDQEVYETNVNSFKYLFRYLIKRIHQWNTENEDLICLKTCIIAGMSDKYTPFVIEDFAEAKFILRGYIRSSIQRFSNWCSGLSINISSTITKAAIAARPHADTVFWFTPQEVVQRSIDELIGEELSYKELELFKPSPYFIEGYYENNEALYIKWSKETGLL